MVDFTHTSAVTSCKGDVCSVFELQASCKGDVCSVFELQAS